MTVDDTGAPLTADDDCDQPTPAGTVTCSVSGLYIVFVDLGDGDDALAVDNHDPSVQFTIGAGEGADSVDVGPLGEVCLDGNAGVDHLTITTPSQACTVDGGEGKDVLTGSDGLDRLYGGPDPDVVLGQGGSDYVYGDDGDDRVDGGPGDEVLIEGGAGDDALAGEGGNDHFGDGPGDDAFEGDSGADTFSSSFFFDSGDDAYTGGPGRDRLVYFCPACRISLDTPPTTAGPRSGRPTTSTSRGSQFPRACRPTRTRATRATTTAPATTRWSATRRTTSSSLSAATTS